MTTRSGVRVGQVYDRRTPLDGARVLVDGRWPRELTENTADLDEWCQDIAPSAALRRWYGRGPERFDEFARRYRAELGEPQRAEALAHLRELAQQQTLTLLTATRRTEISGAVVLAELLGTESGTASGPDLIGTAPRDDTPTLGEVVVGVDGSPGSLAALRWARDEASARGQTLSAVTAWEWPVETTFGAMVTVGDFHPVVGAEETLAKALADTGISPADESVTTVPVEGHPAEVLLRAAAYSRLLVVGSRGHGRLVGTLLGSVSQYVAAHATCPVVVIGRPGQDGRHPHHP